MSNTQEKKTSSQGNERTSSQGNEKNLTNMLNMLVNGDLNPYGGTSVNNTSVNNTNTIDIDSVLQQVLNNGDKTSGMNFLNNLYR